MFTIEAATPAAVAAAAAAAVAAAAAPAAPAATPPATPAPIAAADHPLWPATKYFHVGNYNIHQTLKSKVILTILYNSTTI